MDGGVFHRVGALPALRLLGAGSELRGRCVPQRVVAVAISAAEVAGVDLGQPVEPAREPPVPVAEELHRCGEQDGADDDGVDQDGDGEANTDFFHGDGAEAAEDLGV